MLNVVKHDDGALWEVEFGDGRGNVLDAALVGALIDLFTRAGAARALKALVLRGKGAHFSFGASVEEHLPGAVGAMLPRFHRLFRVMHGSHVVCLASVRGQCLGGGLELAAFCHRVFAAPDAKLGQPEIVLGVFAPMASLLLPDRIGRRNAEDLCFTGRSVAVDEALAMGLVDAVDEAPEHDAAAWARTHLLPHSASSLRFAVRATRHRVGKRLDEELPELERLYLDELMATGDAREGLEAFLAKRTPVWCRP